MQEGRKPLLGCYVYQYMAINAWKCLLSISQSEPLALHGVNINKVLLCRVLQHLQTCQINSVETAHAVLCGRELLIILRNVYFKKKSLQVFFHPPKKL